MIKPEFAFFQMEVKSVFLQAPKADKSCFCEGPEAFNPVNVRNLVGKFIGTMFNAKMLLVAKINKAVVTAPAIGMDNAFKFNAASDYPLESRL